LEKSAFISIPFLYSNARNRPAGKSCKKGEIREMLMNIQQRPVWRADNSTLVGCRCGMQNYFDFSVPQMGNGNFTKALFFIDFI
jgi:hypothetical protein